MTTQKTGPWKVSSNFIGDRKVYQVYRIKNTEEVDHSGNRECSGGYVTERYEAEKLAEILNQKEGSR